ncbi:unnamed protein product, partial [Heterotrigona itama]
CCFMFVSLIKNVQNDFSSSNRQSIIFLRINKENLIIEFGLKIEEEVRSLQKRIKYHCTVVNFIFALIRCSKSLVNVLRHFVQ